MKGFRLTNCTKSKSLVLRTKTQATQRMMKRMKMLRKELIRKKMMMVMKTSLAKEMKAKGTLRTSQMPTGKEEARRMMTTTTVTMMMRTVMRKMRKRRKMKRMFRSHLLRRGSRCNMYSLLFKIRQLVELAECSRRLGEASLCGADNASGKQLCVI